MDELSLVLVRVCLSVALLSVGLFLGFAGWCLACKPCCDKRCCEKRDQCCG